MYIRKEMMKKQHK